MPSGDGLVRLRGRGEDLVLRGPRRERPLVVLVRPPLRVPRASYTTLACPPLALAYLASCLREADIDVQIIDAVGEAPRRYLKLPGRRFVGLGLPDEEIAARIPADATLIGVTCMFSESWPLTRGTIEALRAGHPGTPIVVGGEHPTALPEHCLEDCAAIDVVALGEGEETIVELARAVHEERPLSDIAGLVLRTAGAPQETPTRARIRDIGAIPRPAWDLVPMSGYFDHGLAYGIGRQRSMPILATRGCPYQCTFCSSPRMWTTKWVARDPEDVLDEMQWAIDTWGVENFDFYDLTAILRKDWLVTFCTRMKERGIRVTWQIPSGTRSEALDAEVLGLLSETGVRHIVYAPESGSPAVLRRIKKRVNLERMKESMIAAVRLGMTVKCNLIVGFPDETWAEALETIDFCRELAWLGAADVNIGPFCPYPGSSLYAELEDQLRPLDDDFFDMLAMYSDLAHTRSLSTSMSHRQVTWARFLGMAGFYGLSFLRRPARFVELPRNVASGRHRTRLDRALGDILRRYRDLASA